MKFDFMAHLTFEILRERQKSRLKLSESFEESRSPNEVKCERVFRDIITEFSTRRSTFAISKIPQGLFHSRLAVASAKSNLLSFFPRKKTKMRAAVATC